MHLSLSAKLGRLPISLLPGILDQVPGAVFAIAPYTRLSRAQTQSIEVRETGGDTEEIFGPESQAAIEAFVGANDGRIATVYNQGSEAADALQATADNQPFIATVGVLETGMRFDGSHLQVEVTEAFNFGTSERRGESFFVIAWCKGKGPIISHVETVNTRRRGWWIEIDADGKLNVYMVRNIGTNFYLHLRSNSILDTAIFNNIAVSYGSGNTGNYNADDTKVYLNNEQLDMVTVSDSMNSDIGTSRFFRIGNTAFEGAALNGVISVAAVWPRVLTSDELTKVYNATDPR